ncbi:hypothetical protein E2C01_031475 [Portunus trituberculatus]|uniref:Uncharacterized protein n=1 Tax=Portunus trituberculatus TaxID=210409 RepID=A0A5B7EY76_PORTR|nr:hypothetical protein [Portunus trituberculatus]
MSCSPHLTRSMSRVRRQGGAGLVGAGVWRDTVMRELQLATVRTRRWNELQQKLPLLLLLPMLLLLLFPLTKDRTKGF